MLMSKLIRPLNQPLPLRFSEIESRTFCGHQNCEKHFWNHWFCLVFTKDDDLCVVIWEAGHVDNENCDDCMWFFIHVFEEIKNN